jgi:hypothetical protein
MRVELIKTYLPILIPILTALIGFLFGQRGEEIKLFKVQVHDN